MARFYIDLPSITVGEIITLPLDVARHILVLRLRQNAEITLFNGDGYSYISSITTLDKKTVSVIVNSRQSTGLLAINLHLALAIIANDKMDLAIRSATELGVVEITPIISAYAQKISPDKINNRLEHWQKIGVSACEQCGRNSLPQINAPISFKDFVSEDSRALKIILSPTKSNILDQGNVANTPPTLIRLLVGPEGGFNSNELELAMNNGYTAISLGQNILRAETAVVAGIATIYAKL